MLKMYHTHAAKGESPELWDEIWSRDDSFDDVLYFCAVDPLRQLFERYAQPGMRMLEGGCGLGQYVAYHAARGVKVVGLDFARETLAEIRKRRKSLVLCAGDVATLPFENECFDLYYSGGVVEHFESGAEVALNEAHRVLRPGGVFLVSVPYFSPLRRILLPIKRSHWRRVSHSIVEASNTSNRLQFFQYAYTRSEFKDLLQDSGFRVMATQGYAILWGLYDMPFVHSALSMITRSKRDSSSVRKGESPTSQPSGNQERSPSLARRIAVGEDDAVPIAGKIIRGLRWACANMMMYVCERRHIT
jgi:ubiquinone/menaquinone biosynthesis C-methylase UbiE